MQSERVKVTLPTLLPFLERPSSHKRTFLSGASIVSGHLSIPEYLQRGVATHAKLATSVLISCAVNLGVEKGVRSTASRAVQVCVGGVQMQVNEQGLCVQGHETNMWTKEL